MDDTLSKDSIYKNISKTAEEGIEEKLVDIEGNIVSEASSIDVNLKTDNFGNYIAHNFAPSNVNTDGMSVLSPISGAIDLEAINNDVSSEEGDSYADVADGILGDDIVQQENRHAVGQQRVIDTADYVSVSDDMVDGCAVTACQVQDHLNVVICSSQCKGEVDSDSPGQGPEYDLEDVDNDDDDEEEEFGTPKMTSPTEASDFFPDTFQHSDHAETEEDILDFIDREHGFINPALKNNFEEDDSSLDSISMTSKQSLIPASLKEFCLMQLIADHDKESPFVDQDTPVISADEMDLKYSSERVDLHEVSSSDETGEFKVLGGGCGSTQPAICDTDLEPPCNPEHVGAQTTAGLPPLSRDSEVTGDSAKELPVVPLPTKQKSKRVDCLKKSFIKFGSFGKEHGNVKAKSKKDKDKTKTEVQGKHPKPEPETALRGHPSGSASQAASGCVQQCERSAVRQNNSEASIQAQSSGSPSAQQKPICNPLAVDDAKLHRQNTWLTYQRALHEYKRIAEEYSKSPTVSNKSAMDKLAATLGRLKAQADSAALQLNQSIGAEIMTSNFHHAPSVVKMPSHDMSLDSACFMEEKRDYLAGLPSSNNAISSSIFQRHKKADSMSCPNRLEATKKESSLTRSHSDSFRKHRKEVDDNLRQGNSSDDISNLKMLSARSAVLKRRAEGQGSSETDYSANSSDSAIDQISPVSEKGSGMAAVSLSSSSSNSRRDIMSLDDQECEDDEENINVQGGPFSDFDTLSHRPAHLAVFLNYVILNSDPSPLLFYLITESYPNGSLKEMRKWAFEIFSSFLVEKAPLKICVDEQTVEHIHSTLMFKHDKEEIMRNIFSELRTRLQLDVDYLLADFRNKQYLGLGSLFGDHHLTDNLDKAEQEKIIESSLWKHFTKSVENEEQERSAAMAAALAFVFKHFEYTNSQDNLLESCTAFNTKEKEKSKLSLFSKPSRKAVLQVGHQLLPQQYFTMTHCFLCQNLLCGVGNQGFQCQKCGSNFHKGCVANVKEPCSGKKVQRSPTVVMEKPKPQASNVFGNKNKLKMKLSSNAPSASTAVAAAKERPTEESNSGLLRAEIQGEEDMSSSIASHNRAWDKSEPPKSADDIKFSPFPSRSRNPTDGGLPDDKQNLSDSDADHPKLPSLMRGIETGHNSEAVTTPSEYPFSEFDFETETDLPSLESIIPKEQFKKMKPKEKKRQEVINELFYTECAHVRNLNVMYRLFYHPMQLEHPPDFVNLLFPNLRDMIEVHGNLNKDFKQKRKDSENGIVGEFANLLVSHFSGEKGRRFQMVCATFCQKQSHALEVLKLKQRKDPKLSALLQDAASNSLCRRLELKDFLPTAMQRLTKYPLLIENLLKYTQVDSDEHRLLQLAHKSSKEILSHVNKAVQDYENQLKLAELQKKIDRRPIENSNNPVVAGFKNLDLMRHKLVYDGALTWRLSRDRLINLHVVLLEDLLLLVQKQDEKLVLRCQSTLIAAGREDTKMTHSPIIKLSSVLIKPVATDKCAFFLISTSDVGAQIYDLVAGTKDEKNKWCKRLADAIDTFKMAGAVKTNAQPSESTPVPAAVLCENAESSTVNSHVQESDVNKPSENVVYHETTGHEVLDVAIDEGSLQMDRQDIVWAKGVARQKSSSLFSYLDEIQILDEGIHQSLLQKRDILSKLGQLPEEDSAFILDLPLLPSPSENSDPKDVLVTMVRVSDCLVQHFNSLLKAEEPVTPVIMPEEDDPPPLPARGPFLPNTDALPPPLPPRLYRTMSKPSTLQLTDYCGWMNSRLTYLMRCFLKAEEEKNRPVDLSPPSQVPFSEVRQIENVSADSPNLLTYETEPVEELSLCQEFPAEKLLEEQESKAETFDKEDRDIDLGSRNDFVVGTCVVTTVEGVTSIADDVHPQDSEDHITICTETLFDDDIIDSNDLSNGAQHGTNEALNVPVDSLVENTGI